MRGKPGERIATTIRLPCELMERLRRQADEMGRSFNCLAVNILWRFVRAYRSQ